MFNEIHESSGADQTKSISPEISLGVSAPDDLQMTLDLIRACHRNRRFAMEQRKRTDLALGAFLRTVLGWRKDLSEKERKDIAAQAAALVKNPTGEWATIIEAQVAARGPFETIEKAAVKEMSALAATLPVWAKFGEPIRGFGLASLATILAEAGDPSNYPTPQHFQKRMGLGLVDGVRQGNAGKGAGAETWIRHGYNPMRRSLMWNIGDSMVKGNRDGKYRTLYLERKAFELARAPDMRPIHAHLRAQRYMEKRLLKDLWRAWREIKFGVSVRTENDISPAFNSVAA